MVTENVKAWIGTVPTKCQICDNKLDRTFVDGRMKGHGSWAIMCTECHKAFGTGLGTGCGQMYKNMWIKIGG